MWGAEPIPGGICEFASLTDIMMRAPKLRHCLVVLDEIQVNLSKWRSSTKASLLLRGVAQQIRKFGIDLSVTSNAPDQIDQGLKEQLDFHAMCKSHLPPIDPRDFISMRWYDTQMHYGRGRARSFGGRRIETRLRFGERLWPATNVFQIYDHTVQVDPLEVMGIDAEAVSQMQSERDLGLGLAEVRYFVVNDLVPYYVDTLEASAIVPAMAAEKISQIWQRYDHARCCKGIATEQESEHGCTDGTVVPFNVPVEILERAMVEAGLERKGRSRGFGLPEHDDLEQFKVGGWVAAG